MLRFNVQIDVLYASGVRENMGPFHAVRGPLLQLHRDLDDGMYPQTKPSTRLLRPA